jgi:recombination protein RecR
MRVAKAVSNLIEAFERLPGIGPKKAARLTYYLLHNPQTELERFAAALTNLKKDTVECGVCLNIAETNPCDICGDQLRDKGTICVVEQPLDVLAVERSNGFKGVYHVLHGVINPLHNIGPEEIRLSELFKRVADLGVGMREVVLALNPNMEGEATCLYISRQMQELKEKNSQLSGLKVTRIAHGLPVGADIEYADDQTLTHALSGRRDY